MSQENSKPATGCGCLVLLMCIGVMGAAIALPSFLTITKAKQSEGKQYISSMNRAQQAKFVENGTFVTSVDALGLGIKTETINYKYSLDATKTTSIHYGVSKYKRLKSYVGGVFLVPAYPNAPKDAMTTSSILCEADSSGTIKPAEPTEQNDKLICGKGTTQVTK
ncbi:MAG: type IV pilin-like G/H family protein [Microcoleus sp. PH2017_22_RUC_O_B]|nr:type IV pilin-like G/H family protein [Microcoleus sp. PH2017_21_RUC_O_A]MCC3541632.1 type IV pilin-like G/H family protein [Microcoleus sp. PH2017_22_RUC_O_B]